MDETEASFAERALEAAGVGGWELDLATGRLQWTSVTFAIYGLDPGKPPPFEEALSYYPPAARETLLAAAARARRDGRAYDLELPFVTAAGRLIWVRCCGRGIAQNGRITRLAGTFQDVTAQRLLLERSKRLSLVVEKMTNAVVITDAAGRTEWINEAFTRLTGISAGEIIGRYPGDLLQGEITDIATREHMRGCIERGEGFDVEIVNYTRDGAPYWIAITCTALRDECGGLTGFIAVQADVTARRAAEERARRESAERLRAEATLRHQAEHDPLTGLANRAALMAAFERALSTTETGGPESRAPESGALMLFDVDHFKQINDTRGHDAGDALLVELARRLRALARPEDVAARLGGDEFALLAPGAGQPATAEARLREIFPVLAQPMEFLGQRIDVSLSSGITVFPADGSQHAALLKNADLALYEAKRQGRAGWRAFRPEQAEAFDRRTRMAEAPRRAIAAGEVTVALQPKQFLGGGHAGFEALPHWHDGLRLVPAAEFMAAAEKSWLIGELGRVLLEGAFARLAALRALGHEPGRIAVKVFGSQLQDDAFVGDTQKLLRRCGLRPSHLEVKVTENALLGRGGGAVETALLALHESGVALALDNAGAGLLSLPTLSRLPISRLTIDRSFIAEIGTERRGGAVVLAAIGLAHGLGIEAVACGVETSAQLRFLEKAGCDVVQGPLIAPPMTSTEEAARYLAAC